MIWKLKKERRCINMGADRNIIQNPPIGTWIRFGLILGAIVLAMC